MKTPFQVLAYVLGLLALTVLGVACASQAQLDVGHELAAAAVAATDASSPGGEAITPEEQETLTAIYERLKNAEGLDWSQLIATLGAAAVAAIPALRYGLPFILARIPNEQILGEPEALALDKVARHA